MNLLPILLLALTTVCVAVDDEPTIYGFSVKDADGKVVSMEEYKGQVVLIVNVASQCGLTDSNYRQLKVLEDDYGKAGFRVAAFPCNQFGYQEPSCEADIKTFVSDTFDYKPRLFAKIDVNGDNADPLWTFMKEQQGGTLVDAIKWNFTKFLIDRKGRVVARFAPTTEPLALREQILFLLNNSEDIRRLNQKQNEL